MCRVVVDHISSVLRRVFKDRVMAEHNYKWDDTQTSGRWMMTNAEWTVKLFEDENELIEKGNTSKWDTTLLCRALLRASLHLFKELQPTEEAIKKLRDLRNKKFGHTSTTKMTDQEFTAFIKTVVSSYQDIGVTSEEYASLEAIKSGKLNIFFTHNRMSLW